MLDKDQINEWDEYWSEPPKSYPTPLEMVKYYQEVTGQKVDRLLYERLIREEYAEWKTETPIITSAMKHPYNPEAELKELADLVYVIYGYANARGWNLDEALYRVHSNNLGRMYQPDGSIKRHSNNLGRMYQPDGSIKRREDGKIEKNKAYPKVDLSDLV